MNAQSSKSPIIELTSIVVGILFIVVGSAIKGAWPIGMVGIGLTIVAAFSLILFLPVKLIDSKKQYFVWIASAVLIVFGIWYGVTQQEEAEIFSPSLLGYIGGGALLTSLATYVRKRSH
ncbi:hypothetical protein [uncultured Corynebacterium sp.]|uniref:hypothetical protein n=1 Tax=uncultured Corynebacterium sp. TaxID=159447 RepID=UPI0025DDAFFD|nr:hypothetical protein [uncultured Corynebacterium sp.]